MSLVETTIEKKPVTPVTPVTLRLKGFDWTAKTLAEFPNNDKISGNNTPGVTGCFNTVTGNEFRDEKTTSISIGNQASSNPGYAADLLTYCKQIGVRLWLDRGQLRWLDPMAQDDPCEGLDSELEQYRDELTCLLQAEQGAALDVEQIRQCDRQAFDELMNDERPADS